jgi:hypothetical protein
MLSIFLEEAQEIVDETNASLQQWMQNAEMFRLCKFYSVVCIP